MSKLYFRYGAMSSGKTTSLLQVAHNYGERGQEVLIDDGSYTSESLCGACYLRRGGTVGVGK